MADTAVLNLTWIRLGWARLAEQNLDNDVCHYGV